MSDKMKNGGGGGKGRPPEGRGPRKPGGRAGGPGAGGRPRRPSEEGPGEARRPRPASAESRGPKRAGDDAPRPRRSGDDRPARSKPFPREDRGERAAPGGDRAERPARAKPFRRSEGPAAGGDRPARGKPFRRDEGGERAAPTGDRAQRPARAKPFQRSERPAAAGDHPARGKPFRRDEGGERAAPSGDRAERPARAKPFQRSERPAAGGDRPARGRPFRQTEGGERPRGRPDRGERRPETGDRPFRGRSEDRQRSYSRDAAPKPAGGEGAAPRKDYAERVAKVMARAGLCSRRDAETWIEAGRVSVNGTVIASPALDVTRGDVVVVDGTPLPTRERTRLFLYHKPRGLVTTARDPEGRPTVFGALPPGLPRVVTVGRLDINTEGLLLLTNDGGLSRVMELPDTGWLRRYRVRAYGEVTQADLDRLRDGVTIDGMHYGPVEAELDRDQGDNVWLTLGLREGKNREVKRILEHLGLQVNRLIRLSFGPFQLGDLPEGTVEEVRTRVLSDQLGHDLAEQAQVDFESPVFVYDEEDDFRPKAKVARERPERGAAPERGRRGDRGDAPPRRRDAAEHPARGARWGSDDRTEARAPRRGREVAEAAPEAPRPARRSPTEPRKSVWRAEDSGEPLVRTRQPRRGADPKAARAESGERQHERAGKVQDRRGRAVLVERIKVDPASRIREDKDEKPARTTIRLRRDEDAPARGRGGPRREETGDRPRRSSRWDEAGPAGAERPQRQRFGDKPAGERTGPSRGPRPERGPGGLKGAGGKPGFGRKGFDGGDRPARTRDRTEGDRPATGRFKGPRPGGGAGPGPRPSRGGPDRKGPGGGRGGKPPRRD